MNVSLTDTLWIKIVYNVPIRIEFDSGAIVSIIISRHDFEKYLPNVSLQKSNIYLLSNYCKNNFNILGYANVLVTVQTLQKYLPLYIFDFDKHPLFRMVRSV